MSMAYTNKLPCLYCYRWYNSSDILPILTKGTIIVRGEVYSIQHYVIKFVRDLQQVSDVLRILKFCYTSYLDTVKPVWCGFVYGIQRHFQQYFYYIMAVSFIGGENRSIRRTWSWVQANTRIILRGKIDSHYIQIHDRSISWLDKDISIKSGEVKLVLWTLIYNCLIATMCLTFYQGR
jgi:gamma-glutamylcyclotransferase (GGCT)/AIG2-like uncharacterized protein YtfP